MIILVTWLWQGLVIAAATAALLALARGVGAATRHAIWWMALTAVALLPWAFLIPRAGASGSVDLPPADAAVPLPAAPDGVLLVVAAVWATVALVAMLRIAFSVRAVRRMKAASTPLDSARAARLPMWNALAGARRRPELRVSGDVCAASALGLGRPVILLSPGALALDDDSLDAVVMHEHAHLVRFDDWTQLAQAAVSAVLAWHPAAWFIGRRIRLEREAACDDFVLARGAAARAYARSLLELADTTRLQPWESVAIPGATRSRSELRQRVRRLLDSTRSRDARLAWPACAIAALTMALAIGVSARTPALVVFVETYVPAPPVAALARVAAVATRSLSSGASPSTTVTRTRAVTVAHPSAPSTPGIADVEQAPVPAAAPTASPLALVPTWQRVVPADLELAPAPAEPAPDLSTSPPGSSGPWMSVARTTSSASRSTAGGAKRAGASIGRFFGQAGKAIAGRF